MKQNTTQGHCLYYDIEVAPSLGKVWGKYEQNVIEFQEEWFMLSFAYKWGNGRTKVLALPDFPRYKRHPTDDRMLVKELWKLFNQCEIAIAHNGKNFDYKKTNTRFVCLGLPPPKPYKNLDTLQMARRYFKFNSNKLDDLGNDLGVGRKIQTGGFELWRECISGNMKAWRKMKKYNQQDVELLYKVHQKLIPWTQDILSNNNCPKCSSTNLRKRGFRISVGMRYQRYRCLDCGGWSSERKGEKRAKPLMSL